MSVTVPASPRCGAFIAVFYVYLDQSIAYSTIYPATAHAAMSYDSPVSISGTQGGQPTAALLDNVVYVYYINPSTQQVQFIHAPVQC